MLGVFDIIAFAVFGVLLRIRHGHLVVAVILVVSLGPLPGQIAQQQRHPQAAAINVTSGLGVATLGCFGRSH
jgi:hypothetical protein